MSRETYKEDKYFEDFIIEQDKRIEKFFGVLFKLNESESDKIKQCQRYLANYHKDNMSAKYSIGADADEVKQCFMTYMESLKVCEVSSYAELVDILALAIIFDMEYTEIQSIVENSEYEDALTDALKYYMNHKAVLVSGEKLLFEDYYQVFIDYLNGSLGNEAFQKYMNEDWYSTNEDFAWYDSHMSSQNIYVGYWCWLGTALVKMKSENISECKYLALELLA